MWGARGLCTYFLPFLSVQQFRIQRFTQKQKLALKTNLLDPPLSERLLFKALAISREAGDEDTGLARGSSPLTSKQRLDRDDA